MQSFLEEFVDDLYSNYDSLEDFVFVLPSKRAGNFLRNVLASKAKQTFFSPQIFSIENFVEKISGLSYATNTEQLFLLYECYAQQTNDKIDDFHSFTKWGQTLLQDFNEIDRYLVDSSKIFSYLSSIQELQHWYVQKEKTKMIDDYIQFWNGLEKLYNSFNDSLLNKGLGHQGLVYRTACSRLEKYLSSSKTKRHIFLGFNALNKAETEIIQHILSQSESDIYWDIDRHFIEDTVHDAGFFIRQHQRDWKYFDSNPVKGLSSHYLSKKNIKVIGVPKNVSQAKYVGNLLNTLSKTENGNLENTAIILGDETLMNPILNSVPDTVHSVNITMGYPLSKSPLASMFKELFDLFNSKNKEGWYHKNVIDLLSHPSIQLLLAEEGKNIASEIIREIKTKNWSFINLQKIKSLTNDQNIHLLFISESATPKTIVENFVQIILVLKLKFTEKKDTLALEYLYRFYTLFNQLSELLGMYSFVNNLKSLQSLYKELLSSETLDFQGEPLQGLQIMGMLESRNLDFETVIITSVNEGILPSGKSNNSFIPFDLKKTFGLPTYKEKDAVYTYHFYRLLQRAKNVYLLYNTEPDVLEGGERSRLISQLLTDENKTKDITHQIAAPLAKSNFKALESIKKDASLLDKIVQLGKNGFSPTSLTNYIRNPIDFYKKDILKIRENQEVEEDIAFNTFGTVIHDTLEDLYKPYIGEYLTIDELVKMKPKISPAVQRNFSKSYLEGDFSRGKNHIAYKVILKYIQDFVKLEIEELKRHKIKIIGLEEKLNIQLDIPNMSFPVRLKGKLDRIDEKDGITRIIDYKSGKVEQKNVSVVDWDDLITDYEFSKAFQLLCYSLMYIEKSQPNEIEAGILSFKNLKSGILKFGTKEKKGSRTIDSKITQNTLDEFKSRLTSLLEEIYNPRIPITEKEI